MKVAIMQPYIFPYIGYFQLINSVDKFVILDDVNYINKGWINRNRILVNNQDYVFTIPLKEASQNKLICNSLISDDNKWKDKLIKTIELAYKKSPFFDAVFPIISEIIAIKEQNISKFNVQQLKILNKYLNISTEIIETSSIYQNSNLKAQDKIIDICIKERVQHYINPIGGLELYNKDIFNNKNISLIFLKPINIEYKQFNSNFIPWLSIIDVLMFNSKEEIGFLLNKFELL